MHMHKALCTVLRSLPAWSTEAPNDSHVDQGNSTKFVPVPVLTRLGWF